MKNHIPSNEDLVASLSQSKHIFEGVFDITKLVLNSTLVPYWIDESCFWYRRKTWRGNDFRWVDARAGTNLPAFDHQVLASALAELTKQPVEAKNLPITKVTISANPLIVRFIAFGRQCIFNSSTRECMYFKSDYAVPEDAAASDFNTEMFPPPDKPMSGELFSSPDGKAAAFVQDYNLWLQDLKSGETRPLTYDGRELFSYATTPIAMGYAPNAEIQALWSPNSQLLLTVQTDDRQVDTTPIMQHADNNTRPTYGVYQHALPGDRHTEQVRLVAVDINSGKVQVANYRSIPVHAQSYHGLFVDNLVWWSQDSRIAYFVDIERSTKVAKVLEFDTYTGATRCLFEEKSLSYIKLSHYFPRATILHIADSNELIWFSERSGWAHLYLYDLATGDLKNPITQGEWLVRNILHFDTKRRELWIQTAGRVTGRDPYYQDICRVNIDTGELTVVVSGNAEYTVLSPGTMAHYAARYYDPDIFVNACAVSSDADYVVTTRSRLDQVPVSLLLDRDGNTLQEMEVADLSSLPNTWVWPEPVKLLAADDETAIYGAIFKPSNFSPDKRYPVIDFSPYAPDSICSPKGAFLNNADGGFFYPHAAALAELGFIVVAIDGRGSPAREKAFSHANSGSWSASNFTEDRVSAIKQLGQKYPYIDVDRVGFLGLLSNGNELMDYPDFYKVGVYSNGIYDTRFLGAVFVERYEDNESRLERQSFEAGAIERLKGKLLLIHNLHSRVVAPAATLRVVDALKKANKDFDLLVFPGDMPERYAFRRTLDYFVQHLHGIDPPKEFNFEPDDGQAA